MIFRKKKYYFNPVTLTFEEIKTDRSRRTWYFFMFLLVGFTVSLFSGHLLNRLLGSHETRLLERQLEVLNREMQHIFDMGKQISSTLTHDLFVKDNHYRTILQLDTMAYSQRLAGTGGSAAWNELALQDNLSHQVESMISRLNLQMNIQSGSLEILYTKALEHSIQQTHLPAIQPVAREDLIMVSTDFGVRTDPFFFVERIHNGLDFVASVGKKVYATGDGTVTFVKYSRTGYGNEIVISHGFGFGSRYAHLEMVKVKQGEVVKRGQVIGTVGKTGRATGPHLHYEVIYKNKAVNPSFYYDTSLTRIEFTEIIAKANKD